ncbi:hypothetical protein NQ318_001378 [Aromia moschata]|uniref:Sodium/solute symporter n=1 Tax=Aromia moschata TaxID=1265417 RepID=A0AAV8YUU4_9CUCU|nr:hypothetical protein NQ318_001378 [Aromia moschata]
MGENIPAMMSTLDIGEKTVIGLEVSDVSAAMQRFDWPDYAMFLAMLLICISVGVYYAFSKKSVNSQEYLVGGRNMRVIPVAFSLIASAPATGPAYYRAHAGPDVLLGTFRQWHIASGNSNRNLRLWNSVRLYRRGFFLMSLASVSIYLPVFHGLGLTSTYEYHEKRFDKKVRLFGSLLFTIGLVAWLPLVIYVPALAFNQVTGINVHLITPIVCVICIFYTSMGGLKGVVWTDVIQTVIMFFALLLVIIKGTVDVGGIDVVILRNWNSGRIERPKKKISFDLDPLSRHTIWSLVIGGFMYSLQTSTVNQNMIQRYLALPSLQAAKRALWVFFIGMLLIVGLCSYCGMLIYATFYRCDPLTTMLAKEKDQLLPLLVMDILGDVPGLAGVFVAGIFSAALSSLSTGLNALAAVVLEDFYKPFFRKQLSERQTYYFMQFTVIFMGILCVGMVFVVEKLELFCSLVHALYNLYPITGALVGGISSLIFMSWLCLRAQSLIVSGDLTFPEKPVSTSGCHYLFTPKQSPSSNIHFDPSVNITDITHTDERFMIYRLSYLWYTLIGTFVATFVGLLVSSFTKLQDPRDVDPRLLAPFVRKLIKSRRDTNGSVDRSMCACAHGNTQKTIPVEASSKIDITMEKMVGAETAR